jgi:hypothetical protein
MSSCLGSRATRRPRRRRPARTIENSILRTVSRRAASLAAFVAVLAGCGGSSHNDSKRDFVNRADAICAGYTHKVQALHAPTTFAQTAAYAKVAGRAFAESLTQLRALQAPAALEATYESWLVLADQSLQRVRALERAARAHDSVTIQRLGVEAKAAQARSDQAATQLGLTECANDR